MNGPAAPADDRPPADVVLREAQVRALLAEQHPDLAGLRLHHEAGGWDNEMWRLGDDLAVRLPRRDLAVDLAANEARWLPTLAGLVDVVVPAPVRIGRPTRDYPYPWSVVRWIDGTPAWRTPAADRAAWAPRLADVLTDLHVPAPADAPVNPVRGCPLAERATVVEDRLAALPDARQPLAVLWADALAAPTWDGPPVWLHGDPHPANIVVRDGTLAALVDFGDLTCGDPASDLATAWLSFDAAGRAAFRARLAERGAVDDALWRRARGWAVALGAMMALRTADAAIGAIGRHAVGQLVAEA